jgi:hypothetical protein
MPADYGGAYTRLREDALPRIHSQAGLTAAVTSIAAVLGAAAFIRGPADLTRISDLILAWLAGVLVIVAIIALLLATVLAINAGGLNNAELIGKDDAESYSAEIKRAGGLLQGAHYAAVAAVVLFVAAAAMTWIWSDEVVIHTQDGTAGEVQTFCGRLMTSSNTGVAFVRTKDGRVHAIKIAEIKSNSNATCP